MRDRAYWAKLLPIIQAWVAGTPIQYRDKECGFEWRDTDPFLPAAWYEDVEYRIKPKTVQYRRYFYKLGNSVCVMALPNNPHCDTPDVLEKIIYFVKWIDTEWQEIELPSSTETGG